MRTHERTRVYFRILGQISVVILKRIYYTKSKMTPLCIRVI